MPAPECKKHPTYQAKRAPMSSCTACWVKWLTREVERLSGRVKDHDERVNRYYEDYA